MAASRSLLQNIQQYSWSIFAIATLIAALIFWGMTDTQDLIQVEQSSNTETPIQIQPEKVATTAYLGALSDEVKPLDTSTRVVVAHEHAPEFRGTKFVKDNQRKWVMEIFRSSDEAIIKNFLLSREDRNKFLYLRLNGENQPEQYLLLSGTAASAEEAQQKLVQLNLVLPESIQPKPRQLSTYVDYVNDLGADEMKSSGNKLYAIQLRPAALPKVDETLLLNNNRSSTTSSSSATNTSSLSSPSTTVKTTVTQRDAQGNVVNVQRSQSTSTVPKTEKLQDNSNTVKREISDPFN